MDISAVSTLANSNNTSAVADKLKNNVKSVIRLYRGRAQEHT